MADLQFSVLRGVSDSIEWRFRFKHKFLIQYSYSYQAGFENYDAIHCQNSALIVTNGKRKVRKGEGIWQKNFGSSRTQYFRIRPRLHKSFSCSRQSINWYHSAWCTPIRILIQGLQSSRLYPGFTEFPSIQGLQSSRLYPRFTEFPSIQGLQSSQFYPRFTEFLSLSRVCRVPVYIQGLQSSRLYPRFTEIRLYPGFTEFPSIQGLQSSRISGVYRVPSIQGLQSSRLYPGFTEFPSIQGLQSSIYPGFTEFPSLSRDYRAPVSIQGLQSSRLYPGFTEFPILSKVYRVPVSIQGLQSSRLSKVYKVPVSIQDLLSSCLFPGFTEFPSIQSLPSSMQLQAFNVSSSSVYFLSIPKVFLVCHFLSLTQYLWILLEAPSKSQLLLLWKLDVHSFFHFWFPINPISIQREAGTRLLRWRGRWWWWLYWAS